MGERSSLVGVLRHQHEVAVELFNTDERDLGVLDATKEAVLWVM